MWHDLWQKCIHIDTQNLEQSIAFQLPAWIRWNFLFHWPWHILICIHLVSDLRYTNRSWNPTTKTLYIYISSPQLRAKMPKWQSPKKWQATSCTVADPHIERNNSCQSRSSHHKHKLILTDNNVETIANF